MSEPVREFLRLGKHLLDEDAVVTEKDKDAIVDNLANHRVWLLTDGGSFSALTPMPLRSMDHSDVGSHVRRASADPVSWRVCEIIAAGYIRAGEAVPEVLREWSGDYIDGRIQKREPGAKFKNKLRDIAIAQAVEIAVKAHSVKPTRNEASDTESACDIVAGCLKEHGISLGYDSVKKIYTTRKKRRTTG